MRGNKLKMAYDPYLNLPETIAIILIAVGFLIALLAHSAFAQYGLVLIAGLVFGRLLCRWKPYKKSALILVMLGFLMGYMIGGVGANRKLLVAFYTIGLWIGWMMEKNKVLRTASFE